MKGFTLIEVVVSIGIALALVGSVIVNYNGYNDAQTVKQAALTLKNNIRFAQSKANTGEKPSNCTQLLGYQISFTSNSYTIQASCEPEGLSGNSIAVTFPTSLVFNPVPSAIIFYPVGRGTDLSNATSLSIVGFGRTHTMQISPSGDISDLGVQ
jgi:type II secretory pathway pseudopilin PulG